MGDDTVAHDSGVRPKMKITRVCGTDTNGETYNIRILGSRTPEICDKIIDILDSDFKMGPKNPLKITFSVTKEATCDTDIRDKFEDAPDEQVERIAADIIKMLPDWAD